MFQKLGNVKAFLGSFIYLSALSFSLSPSFFCKFFQEKKADR